MRSIYTSLLICTLIIASSAATKRGLCWPWNGLAQDFNLFKNSPKLNWAYNWESWKPSGFPSNFEYVAMQRTASGITNLYNNMISTGSKTLLGFNEPDIADQANMSPDTAVTLWKQYIQPLKTSLGLRLGSPAVSNGPQGLPWLQQFVSKCTGCSIDFIAIHWYGSDYDSFVNHLLAAKNAFPGKKLWLTEFALNLGASASAQLQFYYRAKTYLDNAEFVERYNWFYPFRGTGGHNLISNSGTLTNLGNAYISY